MADVKKKEEEKAKDLIAPRAKQRTPNWEGFVSFRVFSQRRAGRPTWDPLIFFSLNCNILKNLSFFRGVIKILSEKRLHKTEK